MTKHASLPSRIFFYCFGFYLIALGVVFSVASNLGVAPASALPYVASQITLIDLGLCVTLSHVLFLLMQVLILGRKFQPHALLQLISAVVFGYFITLAQWSLTWLPQAGHYGIQMFYCLMSIFFVALGVLVYLNVELIPLPAEGAVAAIHQRFGCTFSTSKIIFDSLSVILAAITAWACLGAMIGLREGTVLSALGIGLSMKLIRRCTGTLFSVY